MKTIMLLTLFFQPPPVPQGAKPLPSPAKSSVIPNSSPTQKTAGPNAVEGLTIDADQTVPTTKRVVTITAQCDGVAKWIVLSAAGNVVEYQIVNELKCVNVFPPNNEDQIIVLAYTCLKSGGPSDTARSIISVTAGGGGPAPTPTPTPQPLPPPNPTPAPVKAAFASFIFSDAGATPEITAIVNSQTLKATLAKRGLTFQAVGIGSAEVAAGRLGPIAQAAGLPCLILQDSSGNVVKSIRVANVTELLTAVAGN